MKTCFSFFVFIFSSLSASSINSYGQVGYINIPSAYTYGEGTFTAQLLRSEPDRKFNITASPFNWLDATIFYVDITGLDYGGNFKQSYKDKGFNYKFKIKDKGMLPAIAIGGNDIAGTAKFMSEYIVVTDTYNDLEYTLGLGWGQFSEGLKIMNPFINLSNRFENRSDKTAGRGGTFDFNNYFSGEKASFFGGLSYAIKNNVRVMVELDPTKRPGLVGYPETLTKFNLGVEVRHKGIHFKASMIGGNEFQFSLALTENFLNRKDNKFYVANKIDSYNKLQKILESNNIGLVSVSEDKDYIDVKVKQNAFPNQYRVNEIVLANLRRSEIAHSKDILISQRSYDMEVVKTFYSKNTRANIRKEVYQNISNDLQQRYVVYEKFPIIRNNFFPNLRVFLAPREGFLYQGLMLEDNLEVIFSDNFFVTSNFKYSLSDNFDGLYIPPVDVYPNQVRSDVKKYLNNFDRGIVIGRLQADYFKSFDRKHFFRLSAGIFEEMFGGVGIDYVYYPEGSLLSYGIESYFVKKRDYNLKLDFLDYSNSLTRFNIQLAEPRTKIYLKLSIGEYLAGDNGYTFEASRKFHNGIEFGAFFSQTNVSIDQYGEGSFDKGVKMTIPFSIFNPNSTSLSSYVWKPLTKDPAALLNKTVDLHRDISRFRVY